MDKVKIIESKGNLMTPERDSLFKGGGGKRSVKDTDNELGIQSKN